MPIKIQAGEALNYLLNGNQQVAANLWFLNLVHICLLCLGIHNGAECSLESGSVDF